MVDIRNHTAWRNGREAAIRRNASITRYNTWVTESPENQRLHDWLNGTGEFRSVRVRSDNGEEHWDTHPLCVGMFAGDFGRFLISLRDSLQEWGRLTPRQAQIVRDALARKEARVAKGAQRRAAAQKRDAKSEYVGEVGERREFQLAVEKVFSFETQWGVTYINKCRDADGNIVVYKGVNDWPEGEAVKAVATIKEHSEYRGAKQTLINRPKVL